MLNSDAMKRHLQQHLSTGLVVVVGSGLSCAEGLPGMSAIQARLEASDPVAKGVTTKTDWDALLLSIKDVGLESALLKSQVDAPLANFIRTECADCIKGPEVQVIREAISGTRQLRFTRLLPFLPKGERLPIVTSNYDRLLELACEMGGCLVDTKTHGAYHAPFHDTKGTYAYCASIQVIKKSIRKVEHPTVSLYKPHGSLDWIISNGIPHRSVFDVAPSDAMIITPGQQKYAAGYEKPFDRQRELANGAIAKAAKLLIIGYGFNDNHLEVHLSAKIRSGTPTLILTHTLSSSARLFLALESVWAIEKDGARASGSIIYTPEGQINVDEDLWDINGFVKGVWAQ